MGLNSILRISSLKQLFKFNQQLNIEFISNFEFKDLQPKNKKVKDKKDSPKMFLPPPMYKELES